MDCFFFQEKIKYFLRKKEKGQLLVQKTRATFSNLLKEVSQNVLFIDFFKIIFVSLFSITVIYHLMPLFISYFILIALFNQTILRNYS